MTKTLEEEDLQLTYSYEHHQNDNYLQTNSWRNDLKASREDLLQLKIQRRNHNKTWRRGGVVVQSRPTTLCGQPTNRRTITTAEVLPKAWGDQAPPQGPHLEGPALGGQAPEHSGPAGLTFRRGRGCSRDSSLKGLTQNVTCSKTQGRSSNLKARELILRLVDKKSGLEEEEVQGSWGGGKNKLFSYNALLLFFKPRANDYNKTTHPTQGSVSP